MPPPRYDRQALEQERDVEIPAQLASYQRELDATPIEFTERRERFGAQLETCLAQMQEKRLAE